MPLEVVKRAGAAEGVGNYSFRLKILMYDFAILGGGIHWSFYWYGWQSDCRHREL